MPDKKLILRILGLLASLIVALTLFIEESPDDDKSETKPPATVVVDGPDPGLKPDTPIVITPPVESQLEDAIEAEDKPGDTHREFSDPLREDGDGPAGVIEGPLAAQEFPGCRTRFVQNFSSRNGIKPKVIVLHQTVSRERGRSSQDALTAFANRRSSGVSWHFLVGRTNGLCTYTVPLNLKAWTQGNANPFSVGIEVEAFGDESTYVQGAGEAKLISIVREVGRRYDIPMRKGLVQNCRVVRTGIVEHSDLGACGGGHADVTPWPTGALLSRLPQRVTTTDRITCRKLNWWRENGKPHGKPERNAIRRRKALESRDVTCTSKGPVKG